MGLLKIADDALRETSRTFYIPISRLPSGLREAVTSAYLCLRAIDEIEDHPTLRRSTKIKLLCNMSAACNAQSPTELEALLKNANGLPDVTNRICKWISIAPTEVVAGIWQVCAQMSKSMSYWVDRNWRFSSRADLDLYTFGVAGAVGVLLSDLWEWFDGTKSHRGKAIAFGRGLQAVNMLRNQDEDMARGVNFLPEGWCKEDLRTYAKENLALADEYLYELPDGPAKEFCRIPLILAHATLEALDHGARKLSRDAVMKLVVNGGTSTSKRESSSSNERRCLSMSELVVLVDELDRPIGIEEKIVAHRLGIRHRAFSVFILNSRNELLLQKRAKMKYHSAGRWSNTCCGHPRFSESVEEAGRRRLKEEMGLECTIRKLSAFKYKAELENGLVENEYDHVLVGTCEGNPYPNITEVEAWKWVGLREIQRDVTEHPEEFTAWFRIAISILVQEMDKA